MDDARLRRRGRSWVEVIIAFVIACLVVALLMPALNAAVERAWSATCCGHLGELFRATNLYLHPDHGGKYLPASGPDGPPWFEKLEPLVAGYEAGRARGRFVCPKAPPAQQGFARDALSFGWNAADFPIGSVAAQAATPHEKLLLADSLGSAADAEGARADTVVTAAGELRLDARHRGEAHCLFLDGHVGPYTRPRAEEAWPAWALAPPRP
ncbi:MAG: hypothetical protein ACOC8D_01795, partial [bacterium]